MQALIIILLAVSGSLGTSDGTLDYIGQMPEVVVTAPRYEYEDEAWAGLMPETVVTEARYEHEDDAWSGMMPETVVSETRYENEDAAWSGMMPVTVATAPRYISDEQVPKVFMADIVGNIGHAIAEMTTSDDKAEDSADDCYQCVEVIHIPSHRFNMREVEFTPVGMTFSGDYHVLESDTIEDDVTVSGGNATIDGVINGDVAVMGGTVTVNGKVEGDIAVFGGNLDIIGTVNRDAAVFGGNINNQGSIEGDLVVIGGTVLLDSGSVVAGDILMVGGTVDRDDNAQVFGKVESVEIEALEHVLPQISRAFRFPRMFPAHRIFPRLAFVGMLVVLYVFNLLILAIFPYAIDKIADRVQLNVWAALGLGLAIEILFVPVLLLLTISIIGIPLAILLPMAVLIGTLFGFSALALIIGSRISKGFGWNITNKIGLYSLGWLTIMIIPLIVGLIGPPVTALGWVIIYVAMTISAGGVLFTFIKRGTPASK